MSWLKPYNCLPLGGQLTPGVTRKTSGLLTHLPPSGSTGGLIEPFILLASQYSKELHLFPSFPSHSSLTHDFICLLCRHGDGTE